MRIDEFSKNPTTAGLDDTERARFVLFGFDLSSSTTFVAQPAVWSRKARSIKELWGRARRRP
jgi:hypothetical protein